MIKRKKGNIVTMRSPGYNWDMDISTGFFARYGNTYKDDPTFSPIGPEILDIEINTDCCGIHGTPCSWCYKSNITTGKYMNFETFVKVVEHINPYKNLTQIALGVGNVDGNPDFVKILKWCRDNNIVPNITVNGARLHNVYEGLTYAQWIAKYCGAVAVSHYEDDVCFDAVKEFCDLGMTQVNIHQILSVETIDTCIDLIKKRISKEDSRLDKLNAIVFLSLKPKGCRNTLTPIGNRVSDKYKEMISLAMDNGISIGFDSCGANRYIEAIKDTKYKEFEVFAEPCEAACFSFYVNVDGKYFPCSFCECEKNGDVDWTEGIDVLADGFDLFSDLWYSDKVKAFRKKLRDGKRQCPMFNNI